MFLYYIGDGPLGTSVYGYDLSDEVIVFTFRHPDADVLREDIGINFFTTSLFIECLNTAEEDVRVNSWLFLDYSGNKLGSFLYESRSQQLLSKCRGKCRIENGIIYND